MKIKTSKLTGAALDWAVAKCEGHRVDPAEVPAKELANGPYIKWDEYDNFGWVLDDYSTDWAQGGPIIEREKIDTNHISIDQYSGDSYWVASFPRPATHKDLWRFGYGPTLLTAAMRCYVASKLGDEVEVPGGLV
jgi:hypothetical protein